MIQNPFRLELELITLILWGKYNRRWEVFEIGPGKIGKIKSILSDTPTYLTFDIDCLDPAYVPGTGTPVWGGLSSIQASIILADLAGINMVGGDVVEVAPQYDLSGATAIAGAHAVQANLCVGLEQKAPNKMKSYATKNFK